RRRVWEWCVRCLQGPPERPLPYAHLLSQIDRFDITHFQKVVSDFLNARNFQTFGETMEKFFSSTRARGEDLFSYFTRLDNEMKEIEQLEDLAREVGEDTFKIPRWIVVWKMLKAISQEKRYQLKIQELLQKPPSEFLRISASRLRQDIQILHTTNRFCLTRGQHTHTWG